MVHRKVSYFQLLIGYSSLAGLGELASCEGVAAPSGALLGGMMLFYIARAG